MTRIGCAIVLICATLCLAGCATSEPSVSTVSPSSERPAEFAVINAPAASLFKEDQAVISNEDLDKVLTAKVALPAKAKLAVIRFGQLPYWWGWSEDFARMNEKIDADFMGKLGSSARIREVAYLPSLVTPTNMTIPYLRQAAARFQADLILVYRTSTRGYEQQKFLAKDKSRSYCTVEAVLIDTRSGIIPFSTVVTENFTAVRSSSDMDFAETVARTEQQAIAKAWMRLAEQAVGFVDRMQ